MKQLIAKLFEQGRLMGFTDMEVLTNTNESFEVKIYEQQIDSYKVTDSRGMGFGECMITRWVTPIPKSFRKIP